MIHARLSKCLVPGSPRVSLESVGEKSFRPWQPQYVRLKPVSLQYCGDLSGLVCAIWASSVINNESMDFHVLSHRQGFHKPCQSHGINTAADSDSFSGMSLTNTEVGGGRKGGKEYTYPRWKTLPQIEETKAEFFAPDHHLSPVGCTLPSNEIE